MSTEEEKELRSALGEEKTNELMAFVDNLKAQGKSPDEITAEVRRQFSGLTIFHLPGFNKVIMR